MEPETDVISTRRSIAAWLRRAGQAMRDFLGPQEAARSVASGAAKERAAGPTCVWYGRAMFCLYLPEPFPGPGSDGQDAREARRGPDAPPSPELDPAVVGQLEEPHRAD